MTELFAFFGTVPQSEPFPNNVKISTVPYLCVNAIGPHPINSHCFLVSVSNSLSLGV